jgi:ribosomal protein S18 acetylase RimI-like enzyme
MLAPGYQLRRGTGLDRALLVKFMQSTYRELYPTQDFAHLSQTVEQYLSSETPLWWVEREEPNLVAAAISAGSSAAGNSSASNSSASNSSASNSSVTVACLWMGIAVDQTTGWRYPHIFLLYVRPDHRRRGLGLALMRQVESWAQSRGDNQIGLQVFAHNQPALKLYEKLGYQTQSLWMIKPLQPKLQP